MPALTTDRFRPESLLAIAKEKSGIDDPDDTEIVEPLTRLLAAYRDEAGFSAMGLQMTHAHLIDSLVMRRRIRDAIRRHPQILDEPIREPVIILGLPRTGTTKLQRALGASGSFQTLPLWKMLNPLAIPTDPPGTDSRLAVAEQFAAGLQQAIPHFYAGHPMVATEPDEEALLQELSFLSEAPCFMAHLPGYQSWLSGRNTESNYCWLKMVLQLVQWQDERIETARRWLLKSPVHTGRLDEIFAVFPDAVVVHCHRDFLTAVPSAAALTASMRELYTGRFDGREAALDVLDAYGHAWRANGGARKRLEAGGKRFVDVDFEDVANRIDAVAKRIFATTGVPFTAATRAALTQWEADNPPHKHGNFKYDLDTFGLTEAEIRQAFAGGSR